MILYYSWELIINISSQPQKHNHREIEVFQYASSPCLKENAFYL